MKIKEIFSLQMLYMIKGEILKKIGLEKFCKFLEKKTFIRPNHITVLNLGISGLALMFLFRNQFYFVDLLILSFLLDNLDGYYARSRKLESKMGDFLDHSGDFVFGLLFMFKSWLYFGLWWILVAMVFFVIELFSLWRLKLLKDKFPSRVFLIFFAFGWFNFGLTAQLIYQPLSFVLFMGIRWLSRYNS